MNTDERVRAGLRDLVESVPVTPPPAAALRRRAEGRAEGRGESGPGRRWAGWLAPALAAAAVAAVLLVAVVPGWLPPPVAVDPADTDDRPVLPERFAGKTWRTATVTDAPPGPAIAIFRHGTQRRVAEPVIVGADGRTYRTLDAYDYAVMSNAGRDVPLLSPDGSLLAGAGGLVLDLTTGEQVRHPILAGDTEISWASGPVLAWSPDSRLLAYLLGTEQVPRAPGSPNNGAGLAVLDLDTGQVTIIDTNAPQEQQVAFSPDGTEIAVSTEVGWRQTAVKVYDLSGGLLRELRPPPAHELPPGGTGWSPDGALLVMVEPRYWPGRFSFIDATGQGRTVPAPFQIDDSGRGEVAGWRWPDSLLVAAYPHGTNRLRWLLEVPVATEPAAPVESFIIGRFPVDFSVDDRDRVSELRVASGLVATAEIRDTGRPDHGPLSTSMRLLLSIGALAAVGGILLLGWRVGRAWSSGALP